MTSVARTTAEAHGGTHSLAVSVTAPHGWGVTQGNHPGFGTTAGDKTISFWAMKASGGVSAVTMSVHWRDAAGADLASDRVTLAVGTAWTEATAIVTAPAGTAHVGIDFQNSSGTAGDVVYLDDILVAPSPVPPPPPTGLLDDTTTTLESGVGQWSPWFSSAVSSSAEQGHGGARSLRVEVTAPFGWGVTLANFPGFVAAPGPHTIGIWGLSGTGSGLAVTMTVTWRSDDGTVLGTDVVELPLGTVWAQASASVTAPPGTTRVGVDLTSSSGVAGDVLYIDDVEVS